MGIPISHPVVAEAAQPAALELAARYYAVLDPTAAEATIDAYVAGAIAAWRLEDATYWQRVKFRARMIRTMRRNEVPSAPLEAISLPTDGMTDGGER